MSGLTQPETCTTALLIGSISHLLLGGGESFRLVSRKSSGPGGGE